MNISPKVSVCIASYNHGKYLPECLESILAQTFRDFEIIIVDDGSTDGSHELLMSYQSRYPDYIHYYWHPGHINKGISITSNLAIEKSSGEYIAWIGSDDAWYPNKLEIQVGCLENEPEIGLIYSPVYIIDETGKRVTRTIGTNGIWGADLTGELDPLIRLIALNVIPASTVIVRRDCINQIGVFDESLLYSDWELWIRIIAHWKIRFIENPLALYRTHGGNISIGVPTKTRLQNSLDVMFALKEKAFKVGGALMDSRVIDLLENQILNLNLQLAYHYFHEGNAAEATQKIKSAFDANPGINASPRYFAEILLQQQDIESSLANRNELENVFCFWALDHLPSDLSKTFYKQVAGKLFCVAAFSYYSLGRIDEVRRMVIRTLFNDPFYWARNRGLWSIFIESFLGAYFFNITRF